MLQYTAIKTLLMGYGMIKVDQNTDINQIYPWTMLCFNVWWVCLKSNLGFPFAPLSKFHLIQGDWREHHRANKDSLYVIEAVVESLLQLLVQSILVYVVLGPDAGLNKHFFPTFHCILICVANQLCSPGPSNWHLVYALPIHEGARPLRCPPGLLLLLCLHQFCQVGNWLTTQKVK